MFGFFNSPHKTRMPSPEEALPGRTDAVMVSPAHAVLGTAMQPPWDGLEVAIVGMGCFWGAERLFWTAEGVHSTQVGYSAGHTPNPTYQEVCGGRTGHNEVVRVIFDPAVISYGAVLKIFWEGHNPTQGMRQGNDVGTQYRSGIYCSSEAQTVQASTSMKNFQDLLKSSGYGPITTEVIDATKFYYAEDYHQQYLHKNPGGYCGLGGTGVTCPTGLTEAG
ncbi:MAG: peptide-methionine (S)-S-oxide reductase MsrA [Myxococcota bacterium]|nr:peptide-methionine (S)-S-oxide reductase MsrA [Myxococcota bacterium]